MRAHQFSLFAAIAVATGAFAAVTFDAERNAITVADHPRDAPCGLGQVSDADRKHGWGKVEYDEANDTYTVNATLLIGENDRGSTYFQIGTKANPRETLVMKGGLYVTRPRRMVAPRGLGLPRRGFLPPPRRIRRPLRALTSGTTSMGGSSLISRQKRLLVEEVTDAVR